MAEHGLGRIDSGVKPRPMFAADAFDSHPDDEPAESSVFHEGVNRNDVVDALPETGEQQLRRILHLDVALALDDGPRGQGEDGDDHRRKDGIRARMRRAEIIARHRRSCEREDTVFDPLHYLPLIERKLAALDQAPPLAGWELPGAFATLRRLMEARSGRTGRREYVQVLRLLETFGLDDVHAAVKHAFRLGAIGFDAVKHLVLCRVEKRPPRLDLYVYPYLPKANVAKTCAANYLCLMSAGA